MYGSIQASRAVCWSRSQRLFHHTTTSGTLIPVGSRSGEVSAAASNPSPEAASPPVQPFQAGEYELDRWVNVGADDSEVGWGDEARDDAGSGAARSNRAAPGGRGDEWYLDERPPHHG